MIEHLKHLEKAQEPNYKEEIEKFKIENFAKSIYPEEEISNVFKQLIFKTNTDIIKYPKVSKKFLKIILFI